MRAMADTKAEEEEADAQLHRPGRASEARASVYSFPSGPIPSPTSYVDQHPFQGHLDLQDSVG